METLKHGQASTAIQHYIEGRPVPTSDRTLVVNFVSTDALLYSACLNTRRTTPNRTIAIHLRLVQDYSIALLLPQLLNPVGPIPESGS